MMNTLTPRMLPAFASNEGDLVETPRSGSPVGSIGESSAGGSAVAVASGQASIADGIVSRSCSPAAELGLGSLATERQLIDALRSKDRLFVLGLGQDIESFIQRLQLASPESLIDVKPLGVSAQSKFQRMLVYKAAEWYGLKAVAGGEGQVHVGLAMIGLNEASPRLRLSALVPREPSPPQMFKIMRRTAPSSSSSTRSVAASTATGNGNISRATSVSGDNDGSERERKTMTIEEREREYAKVRMRIFKSGEEDETSSTSGSVKGRDRDDELADRDRGRQQRAEMRGDSEDEDPVSRHAYTVKGWEEPIFASVYQQSVPPPPTSVASSSSASVPPAHQPQTVPPAMYSQGYPHQYYGPPGQLYGLQTPTQQPQQLPRMMGPHPYPPGGRQQAFPPQQQFYPEQVEQWGPQYYPPYQDNYGYPPPLPPYGHAPSQYTDSPSSGNLSSPIPTRPNNYHHYSATSSSSISSRSIDGSRPHSRGSTTSSRSGGARMGAMYPATAVPGPGQRRRAMSKGTGVELRSWSEGAQDGASPGTPGSRSAREESPSSTTSSSSRSRHSIPVPALLPGQHPLPNRPDWSANNVPYQPSPRPAPAPPTTADFPPLRGAGTDAIPMQSERAKVRPTPGVWDGAHARKALQHVDSQHLHHLQQQHQQQQQLYAQQQLHHQQLQQQQLHQQQLQQQMLLQQRQQQSPQILPNPMYQYQPRPPPAPTPQSKNSSRADDLDFPKRSVRSSGSLYNPTGSASAPPIALSPAPFPPTIPTVGERDGLSSEELMEAKLAALAVSTGVVIGPAPSKKKQVQSYARIVRRE